MFSAFFMFNFGDLAALGSESHLFTPPVFYYFCTEHVVEDELKGTQVVKRSKEASIRSIHSDACM
jgi:hypothetical protein